VIAVGAYIGAAYWFTSSTSSANPAVTIGRMFSDTPHWPGIRLSRKPTERPRYGIASAHLICPSKPSDSAMAR
jgi:hypothetical protein